MMFRSADVKPENPKNGDKWRNNKGTFVFRCGSWKKINNETQQTFCKKCGNAYEYSKFLQCMQCPKCTPEKLAPIIQKIIFTSPSVYK